MTRAAWLRAARVARRCVAALAVPIGLFIGVTTMVLVAAATAHRTVAAVIGAVALVAASGSVGWWGLCGIRHRTGLALGVAGTALALTAMLVGAVFYAPGPAATPYPAAPEVRYWDLPTGSRIAYTVVAAADPRPTPVVLVHGGPGAPGPLSPEPTAALAAAGFDVYAYHQLGSGLSSRLADPSGYTVARHVADLEAIRVRLDADKIMLVGASWGGQLIANYLAEHSDRVEKAVVSSPGPIWSPAFDDNVRLTESGREDQAEAIAQQPRFMLAHLLMNVIGPRVAHALLPDSTMDGVYEAVVAEIDMRPGCTPGREPDHTDPPAGFGFWANAATVLHSQRIPDPRPRLRQLTTPVLVLRGECDYVGWPVAREYRDLLPAAVLIPVADDGHTIAEDQPELFRQAVLAFLLDNPLPARPYEGSHSP